MRKEKINSLITDDLFDNCKIQPKAYEFGTFRIIGDIELIGFNEEYTNVILYLYFNHWNKSFFMVMHYRSLKVWVVEFNYIKNPIHNLCTLDYYINQEVCRISEEDEFNGVLKYNTWDRMFTYYNTNGKKQKLKKA